jgi:hypothetical protein
MDILSRRQYLECVTEKFQQGNAMADKRHQLDRVRQKPLTQNAFRIRLNRAAGSIVAIAAGLLGSWGSAVATKSAPPGKRPGEVGGGPDWQYFQAVPPAQSRWIRLLSSAISR